MAFIGARRPPAQPGTPPPAYTPPIPGRPTGAAQAAAAVPPTAQPVTAAGTAGMTAPATPPPVKPPNFLNTALTGTGIGARAGQGYGTATLAGGPFKGTGATPGFAAPGANAGVGAQVSKDPNAAPGVSGAFNIDDFYKDLIGQHDKSWEGRQGEVDRYMAAGQRRAGTVAGQMGSLGGGMLGGQRQAMLSGMGELDKQRNQWEQGKRELSLQYMDKKREDQQRLEDKAFEKETMDLGHTQSLELLGQQNALENGTAPVGDKTPIPGMPGISKQDGGASDGGTAYFSQSGNSVSEGTLKSILGPQWGAVAGNPATLAKVIAFVADYAANYGGQLPTTEQIMAGAK